MTFTPILWVLAFIPALIALYFLKLRRQERVVSSTLLWRRSVEELHVNAPFQRLRRSLLLLLQLIVLIGLILSLWRPRTIGDLVAGRNVVLLMDISASMAAREEEGVRLDAAKRRATELIRAMKEGDRMTILTFAGETTTVVPLTEDVNALLAAVDAIEPTAGPTNLEEGLVVAGSVASSLSGAKIYVLGDGAYPENLELPDEVKRQNVEFSSAGATHLENVAITELDVRQTFEIDRRTEVLAVVENTGPEPWSGAVSLFLEDELKDLRELTLAPGHSSPVVFDASTFSEGIVRVEIDAKDGLAADNRAWAALSTPDPVKVLLVGTRERWDGIELVLSTSTRVSYEHISLGAYNERVKSDQREERIERLGADVAIFDGHAPSGPPLIPSVYVGCLPTLPEGVNPPVEVDQPVVIDWDRTHPVNRLVVYTDVFIEKATAFTSGPSFHSLVESDRGSLIGTLTYRQPGAAPIPVVVIGFDILESNWPIGHYSFVIFFSNALTWLDQTTHGVERSRYRSGEPIVYRPSDKDTHLDWESARIRAPSGSVRVPGRDENGALVLAAPEEVGVYEIVVGGETLSRLPVGLLNARESQLAPREKISFGEFEVDVSADMEEGTRHLWKWFALAALAFLLLEWFVYNRRLGY